MTLTLPLDTEIAVTRWFNAPRAIVYEAHSRCEHLARWLGPRVLTMTSCEMDFRAGGSYRRVQQGPDKTEHAFRGKFLDVLPPERIVQTFEWEAMPGHISTETLVLEEDSVRTKLTARSVFKSKEDRDGMLVGGQMEAGMQDSYNRLDELLATLGAAQRS